MIGSMASIPIHDAKKASKPTSAFYGDLLQERMFDQYQVEVPIIPWPKSPTRIVRSSAPAYNLMEDYRMLAQAFYRTR